jgi:hypothetical protein
VHVPEDLDFHQRMWLIFVCLMILSERQLFVLVMLVELIFLFIFYFYQWVDIWHRLDVNPCAPEDHIIDLM